MDNPPAMPENPTLNRTNLSIDDPAVVQEACSHDRGPDQDTIITIEQAVARWRETNPCMIRLALHSATSGADGESTPKSLPGDQS